MKAAFTCSYILADSPLNMEMNFPHDTVIKASDVQISLRRLDMDILRVLAFAPAFAHRPVNGAPAHPQGGEQALMTLFGGSGRADQVPRGSFNPAYAVALDQAEFGAKEGEVSVYHAASVIRKSARLLVCHSPTHIIGTYQAC